MAMASYETLPATTRSAPRPFSGPSASAWNSNLSMCAQQVFASTLLTRADLAVLLVSLAPQLEAEDQQIAGAFRYCRLPAPVKILTAVRCNLFAFDRLDHRFFPSQVARPEEVRSAVEGMCRILDIKPPVWCHGEEVTAGCTVISIPVRGEQIAELVSRLTETEKP